MNELEQLRQAAIGWAQQADAALRDVQVGAGNAMESLIPRDQYGHLPQADPRVAYAHACAALSSAFSALLNEFSRGRREPTSVLPPPSPSP
jgi:hypothetical protein